MSSSWWTLIRSRLPDPVGGFIFDQRGTPANPLLPQFVAQKCMISGVYVRSTIFSK